MNSHSAPCTFAQSTCFCSLSPQVSMVVPSRVFVFFVWGYLARNCFSGRKRSFLLFSGHGANKDLNWTLNHELAAKPVLIYEVACTDSRVLRKVMSWLLCTFELHHPSLKSACCNFSLCNLRKPFCSPKMQCNVTPATYFGSCLSLKWGKD